MQGVIDALSMGRAGSWAGGDNQRGRGMTGMVGAIASRCHIPLSVASPVIQHTASVVNIAPPMVLLSVETTARRSVIMQVS